LAENALSTGAYLAEQLAALARRHQAIGDVRNAGLYVGVEIVKDQTSREPDEAAATAAVNGMRERNVLIGTAGKYGNVLKIRPPLCFSRDNADMLAVALSDALAAHSDRQRR
jgi:4-aminobutyrate aminotransferase-like enzyme